MNTIIEKLPERLRNARKDMGLTQEALGEMVYACGGAVSDWERGRTIPRADHIVLLSRALRVKVEWLLGISEEKGRNAKWSKDSERGCMKPERLRN